MAVESAADRAALVSSDDWGGEIEYFPLAGGMATFEAIFDSAFLQVDVSAGANIGSVGSQFECASDDLPAGAAHGDTVKIGVVFYTVSEVEPDGTGMTVVRLDKQ